MRQTRDLARVGWRGLAPFLPIGPRERPRLADSFPRLGQARGASPGSLDRKVTRFYPPTPVRAYLS